VNIKTFITCILCSFIILLGALLFIEFKAEPNLSTINSDNRVVDNKYAGRSITNASNSKPTKKIVGNKSTKSQNTTAKQLNQDVTTPVISSTLPEENSNNQAINNNNTNSNFAQSGIEFNQSKQLNQPSTDNRRSLYNDSVTSSINNLNIEKKPIPNQFSNTDETSSENFNNDLEEDTDQISEDSLKLDPQVIIAGDIAGKVIDDDGVALANVIVIATPFDVAEGQDGTARQRLTTKTDSEGSYIFTNVATASYKICNAATKNITRSCIQMLPPQKTADLKVRNLNLQMKVFGQVTDESGSPIKDVNVRLSAQNSVKDTTTNDGRYSIVTSISKDENPTVYFQHTDYSRSTARIMTNQTPQENGYEMNAQLTRIEGFTVTGRIIDEEGQPVAGQNIGIRDSNNKGVSRRYARSDNNGAVRIQHIAAGEAYSPIVIPSAEYTYKAPEQKITFDVFDNSANFEVVVTSKQLTYSELRLYINNQAQQPVTGVKFNLISAGKSLGSAKTDENGELLFNKVPESYLTLNSSVLPLNVSRISRDLNNGATITADTGENDIIINITGKDNEPIFCKNASIRWFLLQNGMRIQSRKNLVVDQNGRIEGSKFGAGEHELDLKRCTSTTTDSAHRNKNQKINIGSQIEFLVELDPL